MGKSNNFLEFSESGNWNVAGWYANLKIMKILYENDEFINIARYGTLDLASEFVNDEQTKVLSRIKAITRLLHNLKMLINNTRFALTSTTDKKFLVKCKEQLESLEKHLPKIQEKITFQKQGITQIGINEKLFFELLDALEDIAEMINTPLNNAELIFTKVDIFDPDRFKDELKERMINRG